MLGPNSDAYYDSSERQGFLLNMKLKVDEALSGREEVDIVGYDAWGVSGVDNITVYLVANGKTNIKETLKEFSKAEDFDSLDEAVQGMMGELEGIREILSKDISSINYKNGSNYDFNLDGDIESKETKLSRIDVRVPELIYRAETDTERRYLVMKIYPTIESAQRAREREEYKIEPSRIKVGAMKNPMDPTGFLPTGEKDLFVEKDNFYVNKDLMRE